MKRSDQETQTLTRGEKVAWGITGSSENILHNTTNMMANPILNIGLGMSPVLVSVALTIPRIWDAFTDPFMGKISDNYRSRMGRRRPFILVGGILTGLSFAWVWMLPSGWSEMALFSLFLCNMLLFYTFFTVMIVPYLALGFEMSPDYNERTTLMSYRSVFSIVGSVMMQWIYWVCTRSVFVDTVEGMRYVGAALGVFVIVTSIVTAIFCKENEGAEHSAQPKISMYESFSVSWKVIPFIQIIACCVLIIIGILSVMQVGMYLNIYYVCGGNQAAAGELQGVLGTGYVLMSLVTVPLVTKASHLYGKRTTLRVLTLMGAVGSLLAFVLITPRYPYLQMLSLFFGAPAVTGLWIIAPSMIADVCDYDEWKNGVRREGAFGAAYGWFTKIGSSAAILVSGAVLVSTGFNASLGAEQSEGTLFGMRSLVAMVPFVAYMAANLVIRTYPVDAGMVEEIHRDLRKETPATG